MAYAEQMVVLSLAGLRRLRFVSDCAGEPIPAEERDSAESAARTALASLGLAAIVLQRANGFDLRSRSLLVGKGPLALEMVGRDGSNTHVSLDRDGARKLVAEAEAEARKHKLGWDSKPILLKPAPKLEQLIRESRKLKQIGETEENV
jgi:CRISPR-associated protein Csb1